MRDEELREYAEALIYDHAFDIEWLSIFETYDSWHGEQISEEDAARVSDLIKNAKITVELESKS